MCCHVRCQLSPVASRIESIVTYSNRAIPKHAKRVLVPLLRIARQPRQPHAVAWQHDSTTSDATNVTIQRIAVAHSRLNTKFTATIYPSFLIGLQTCMPTAKSSLESWYRSSLGLVPQRAFRLHTMLSLVTSLAVRLECRTMHAT